MGDREIRESEREKKAKKVTKETIAEEIRLLRQDDRDLKQGFRSLQAKSSMIKHEGLLSGGVSLLQNEVDPKPVLSRSVKSNIKLPSLPSANQELQKLQALMKQQHIELGFIDGPKEEELEEDFKS